MVYCLSSDSGVSRLQSGSRHADLDQQCSPSAGAVGQPEPGQLHPQGEDQTLDLFPVLQKTLTQVQVVLNRDQFMNKTQILEEMLTGSGSVICEERRGFDPERPLMFLFPLSLVRPQEEAAAR